MREFRAFVDQEIKAGLDGTSRAGDGHMLHRLMQVHDGLDTPVGRQRVIDRLSSLLGAFETVCSAFRWCCYHVVRHPAVLRAARTAADDGNDDTAEGGAYLTAIVQESLRLSPPFVGALRRVCSPARVGDLMLQPGTLVMPCTFLTHRRPDVFPDPLKFRPERFLGVPFAPYEYAPFGMGVRRCVGNALALEQLRTLVGELARRFDLRPAGSWSGRDRRQAVVLLPKDALRVELCRLPARSTAA